MAAVTPMRPTIHVGFMRFDFSVRIWLLVGAAAAAEIIRGAVAEVLLAALLAATIALLAALLASIVTTSFVSLLLVLPIPSLILCLLLERLLLLLEGLLLVRHRIHWRWLSCREVHLLLEHLRHRIELLLNGIHLGVVV